MNLTFSTHSFSPDLPREFGQWAIRHRLYKRSSAFDSHFLALYRGQEKSPNGFLVTVAMDGDKPAGLAIMERTHQIFQATTVVFRGTQACKPEKKDWNFHYLGRVGLYVANAYREKGLATKLIQNLEQERLEKLSSLMMGEKDVLCLSAGEKAYSIAQKALQSCYTLEDSFGCLRRTSEIDRLTRLIEMYRAGYDVDTRCIKKRHDLLAIGDTRLTTCNV